MEELAADLPQYVQRFTGKASDYALYRERYDPEIVLPVLRELCGLMPDWSIADVGAGTGMVGDIFRVNGNRVFAIEPNAEMRAVCEGLHTSDSQFSVLDGSAEHTGLSDCSIDMIAIGRALHWFDIDRAIPEFRRILKPRGWVAILACGRRDDGREENAAFDAVLDRITGRDTSPERLLRVYDQVPALFPGGEFHHAETDGELHLDWDQVRGLALSISHTPMPGSPNFDTFEAALRSYFDRYANQGRVNLAVRTWISVGRFAE